MGLVLCQQDLHLLAELVERELSDASVEARRTSTRGYREQLTGTRDRLRVILGHLKEAEHAKDRRSAEGDSDKGASSNLGDEGYLVSIMMGNL